MKIPVFYIIYSLAILLSFAAAAQQGYALSSLFSNQQKASKTDNHYHK